MRRLARRLWRWLLWTIGLAAVASIVANLVFVDYHQASRELPKALREYREEGLPWLASDLALPNIRESENAAEPLRRAIAALPKNTIDYNPSGNVPYGILRPVAGYERAFALVAEAVRRPRLDFGRDLDIGAYVLFPEEAGVKHLVRALMGRAELRTRKGDDAGALADLDIARHLVRLIAQDRGMVAALVAASCDGMISGQARRCLVQAANDPARLRRYRDWLARPAPLLDLRRPFRDEIFMAVANARNLDRLGVGTSWNPFTDMEPFMCHYPHDDEPTLELTSANVRRDGLPQALRARAYLARNLQMWTELSRDTNRLREPIEKVTAHTDTIVLRYASPFTTSHIFDPLLFPVYAQFGRSSAPRDQRTLADEQHRSRSSR
ncbi:hypothetical protein EON82_09735 [bacterium]|nr:MAG: hypothetical protein EON82_09735 [bacterium]